MPRRKLERKQKGKRGKKEKKKKGVRPRSISSYYWRGDQPFFAKPSSKDRAEIRAFTRKKREGGKEKKGKKENAHGGVKIKFRAETTVSPTTHRPRK